MAIKIVSNALTTRTIVMALFLLVLSGRTVAKPRLGEVVVEGHGFCDDVNCRTYIAPRGGGGGGGHIPGDRDWSRPRGGGGGGINQSEQMCNDLRNKKPANCDLSNPPLTPDFNPGEWTPNGCGSNDLGSVILDQLASISRPLTGGAGLDKPALGINFRSACDKHDACWAQALPRTDCDRTFANNLEMICRSSWNPLCNIYREAYVGGVASRRGTEIYEASVAAHACAAWASEMKKAGCRE